MFAPAAVLFIVYCGWDSDWLLVFWPTAVTLLGDTPRPPTRFEVAIGWATAIALNVLLYAILGAIIWTLLAVVRQLRAKSD
jgi:hypothetical protein